MLYPRLLRSSRLTLDVLGYMLAASMTLRFCAACAGEEAASATAPNEHADISEVLANIRKAIGWERIQRQNNGIIARGIMKFGSREFAYKTIFSPDGKFATSSDGASWSAVGFDGRTAWQTDFAGLPYILETSLDEFDGSKLYGWLSSGYWLDENSGVAARVLEGRSDDDKLVLSLWLNAGRARKWVVVDRRTWLPKAVSDPGRIETPDYELDEYREVMGFRWPYRMISRDIAGDLKSVIEYSEVVEAVDTSGAYYGPISDAMAETKFDAATQSVVSLKRAPSGHLLVRPRIDAKALGWFVLDSGAGAMVLSPKAVEKGNLPCLWTWKTGPVRSPLEVGLRGPEDLQLGPITISNLVFMEMPISSVLSSTGREAVGVLGYELFRRAIVEIDLANGTLGLHDPAGYKAEGVNWQRLLYYERMPHIRCRFEGGREGLFLIDIGACGTVKFDAAAVRHFKLLRGRNTSPGFSYGYGAENPYSTPHYGSLEWFELAGHRIENVKDVTFASSDKWERYTDRRPCGLIGLGILSKFKVIFDYPHKRVAFVKLPEAMEAVGESDGSDLPEPAQ